MPSQDTAEVIGSRSPSQDLARWVPAVGFGPTRAYAQCLARTSRLPFPPRRHPESGRLPVEAQRPRDAPSQDPRTADRRWGSGGGPALPFRCGAWRRYAQASQRRRDCGRRREWLVQGSGDAWLGTPVSVSVARRWYPRNVWPSLRRSHRRVKRDSAVGTGGGIRTHTGFRPVRCEGTAGNVAG